MPTFLSSVSPYDNRHSNCQLQAHHTSKRDPTHPHHSKTPLSSSPPPALALASRPSRQLRLGSTTLALVRRVFPLVCLCSPVQGLINLASTLAALDLLLFD